MDNKVKALILMVVLFLIIGFLTNTNNNTQVKYPSLLSTSNMTSINSSLIGPQEAIAIANQNIPAFGQVRYGVVLVPNGYNPILYGNSLW